MAKKLWTLVAFLAIASLMVGATPIISPVARVVAPNRPERIVTATGVRIPYGFEAFEKSITAGMARKVNEEPVDCPEVPEPDVPTGIPSWAAEEVSELRSHGFEELVDSATGEPAVAFVSGWEVVMKTCSAAALAAVVERTKVNWSNTDPFWDIYFDCDASQTWTIKPTSTLNFGKGSKQLAGSWRLLAPHFNVVLHGSEKRRIMQVMALAHVTVYGLTFTKGWAVNEQASATIPTGGWNGGAINVLSRAAVTAYKCDFTDNKALSYYARWGGGGAIKGETESFTLVWGCTFQNNHASVGGAIATSSAHVMYVRKSTLDENVAYGGLDNSAENLGNEKERILIRGGAIRVDSVAGHESTKEHVLLCNSNFVGNKVIFSEDALVNKFGYAHEDVDFVRAGGAAVTAWNSAGTLKLESGDQHFLKVKGCTFEENQEHVDFEGSRLGAYVIEVEGAGHCDLSHSTFRNNDVDRAVARVDNSIRFDDGMRYITRLENVGFYRNGKVFNLEFHAAAYESMCTIKSVDGIEDSEGDCRKKLKEAEEDGGNVSVTDPSDPSPSPTPTPNP